MKIKEPPYTAAEEADFYRRNGGGPVTMTSLTRGRGYFGNWEPDDHCRAFFTEQLGKELKREQAQWQADRPTYHDAHIIDFKALPDHWHHVGAYFAEQACLEIARQRRAQAQ